MDSTKDRYVATLASGYAFMGLQIVFSLVSVPLALRYLGKEGYGIWALGTQVIVWLSMLDAGMTGAIARYLIDYRLHPESGDLKKCISTGFRIFSLQGLIVLLMAFGMSRFSGRFFDLTPGQAADFNRLLMFCGAAACLNFFTKVSQSWLYASQRLDICNIIALIVTGGEFALLVTLLDSGHGINALIWSRVLGAAAVSLLNFLFAVKIANFPLHMLIGRWDSPMFRRLATFGGGMFFMTLGTQLLTLTQTALVSKSLGLATAAVWATAPKLSQVGLQFTSKLLDYRTPHLSALMAGKQTEKLIYGFTHLFRTTAYLGGGMLGAIVAMNPWFLAIWTSQTIHWNHSNDVLIAIAFYTALLIRCFTDFVLHTKKVGWMPALMLAEGLIFVSAALYLLPRYGITGMICASMIAGGALRLPYGWSLFRSYLSLDNRRSMRLVIIAVTGAALGISIHFVLTFLESLTGSFSAWTQLLTQGAAASLLLGPLALKLITFGGKSGQPS